MQEVSEEELQHWIRLQSMRAVAWPNRSLLKKRPVALRFINHRWQPTRFPKVQYTFCQQAANLAADVQGLIDLPRNLG